MDDATKKTIDEMSYESMFSRWRFSAAGDPIFQGETGKYFAKVMKAKREALPPGEHTAISKQLGW